MSQVEIEFLSSQSAELSIALRRSLADLLRIENILNFPRFQNNNTAAECKQQQKEKHEIIQRSY